MDRNPCKDCIAFPICYSLFEDNPQIGKSLLPLLKRCPLLHEYIISISYQTELYRELEIYTYYTGYNNGAKQHGKKKE